MRLQSKLTQVKLSLLLEWTTNYLYLFVVYGPADWNIAYPICAHQAQSPIDIDARSIQPKHFSDELDIDFHNDDGLVVGTLSNNGHAPTLTIDKSRGTAILTCGPANGVFVLEQFHFHFGCNNTEGSEHTVNRVSYPAEVKKEALLYLFF